MPGKEYAIVVKAAESEEALCFVARPFSADFDAIYDAIQVAAGRCNLKACTTRDFRDDKDFTQKFIKTIASAKLVISVCSPVTNGNVFLANDNVMYELGIAHMLGKKSIILTVDSEHKPSDITNRIFLKYSPHLDANQANIDMIERAITNALAGPPDFLHGILEDDIWTVESTQFLFTKKAFWERFNEVISNIDKLFDDFAGFENVCVVPCRSQLDEIQRRDPKESVSMRQMFRDLWFSTADYYENYIAPHVRDIRDRKQNGISEKFLTMINISCDEHIKKQLERANDAWITLVKSILSCDEAVITFKQLASHQNITTRYVDNQQILHDQFGNMDLYTRAVNKNISVLLGKFRKMFSL